MSNDGNGSSGGRGALAFQVILGLLTSVALAAAVSLGARTDALEDRERLLLQRTATLEERYSTIILLLTDIKADNKARDTTHPTRP